MRTIKSNEPFCLDIHTISPIKGFIRAIWHVYLFAMYPRYLSIYRGIDIKESEKFNRNWKG